MYDPNTIYQVPINKLVRSHLNCRTVDESHVATLVDQLNRRANLGAITCRPSGDTFEICCGQHRVEAHKRLGMLTIESYIKYMTDSDFMADSIRENINRKSLSNVELWDNAKNLYQMGRSTKEIAEILGTTVTTTRDYICCGYFLSDSIKNIIDKRGIATSLCKINKLHQQPVVDRIKAQPKATIVSSKIIIDEYIKNHPESQQKCSIKDIPISSTMSQIQTPTILPRQTPIAQQQVPITPRQIPITPRQIPIAQQQIPITPRQMPIAQQQIPIAQQQIPITPRQIPIAPRQMPIAQQQIPITPRQIPIAQQQIPIAQQISNGASYNIININNSILPLTNDNLILLSRAIENIPQLWDLNQFIINKLPGHG